MKKGEEQVNKAQEYTDGLIESEEKKFEERIKSQFCQFCLMSNPRSFAELPLKVKHPEDKPLVVICDRQSMQTRMQ